MQPADAPAAVVFDLDGTLVDTVGTRIDAWTVALAEWGITVGATDLGPLIGMDGPRLAREISAGTATPLDAEAAREVDRRAGELFDERNRQPRPLPGARACLAMLDSAAVTWAIATSSKAAQVTASVAALELAREPRVVDGSSVEHAKPAPDLLLLASRQLGVEPQRTWYVGDSTWDMEAAVAAGMTAIGVLAGAAVDEAALRHAGASVVIETLEQLKLPS